MRGSDWTDGEILVALDLSADGCPASVIGKRLGRSRGSVIGMRSRVRAEADAVPCRSVRPENRDGGMPAGWWRMRRGAST